MSVLPPEAGNVPSRPGAPVTWLLPVKDGMPFLPHALRTIEAQTYRDWQVLAWDNGSTDGSVEVLRRWIPERLPGIVVTDRPMGLGESLAAMVNMTASPLCARIDADDLNLPDRLALQVDFLESHPDVAAMGGQMLLIDGEGRDLGASATFALTDAEIVGDMLDGPGMGHPTVLFRREAVLAAGNYRDVGAINVEDYDLWLRLAVHHRLANLAAPVLRYRVHARSSTVEATRLGHLHAAVRARLADVGPALFGCSRHNAQRLATNQHPFALVPVFGMARHLAARSGISTWAVLRSHRFVQGARALLSPADVVTRGVMQALAGRPGLFMRRMRRGSRTR